MLPSISRRSGALPLLLLCLIYGLIAPPPAALGQTATLLNPQPNDTISALNTDDAAYSALGNAPGSAYVLNGISHNTDLITVNIYGVSAGKIALPAIKTLTASATHGVWETVWYIPANILGAATTGAFYLEVIPSLQGKAGTFTDASGTSITSILDTNNLSHKAAPVTINADATKIAGGLTLMPTSVRSSLYLPAYDPTNLATGNKATAYTTSLQIRSFFNDAADSIKMVTLTDSINGAGKTSSYAAADLINLNNDDLFNPGALKGVPITLTLTNAAGLTSGITPINLAFQARVAAAKNSAVFARSVIVDTSAPSTPALTNSIVDAAGLHLAGTVSDNVGTVGLSMLGGIDRVEVTVNTLGAAPLYPIASTQKYLALLSYGATPTAQVSFRLDAPVTAGTSYSYAVAAYDYAGNSTATAVSSRLTASSFGAFGTALTSLSFKMFNALGAEGGVSAPLTPTPPAVVFARGAALDVYGQVNDYGLSSWDLQLRDSANAALITLLGSKNGPLAPAITAPEKLTTASLDTTVGALNTAGPVEYILRLQTYDAQSQGGNILTTKTQHIVIDNQAPIGAIAVTPSASPPPTIYYFNNTTTAVTITGTVTGEGQVGASAFSSTGTAQIFEGATVRATASRDTAQDGAAAEDYTGGTSVTYALPTAAAAAAISEGTHTYEVVAIDRAGNRNAGHVTTVPIVIDRTNPSISIACPADGTTQIAGSTVIATAYDANLDSVAPVTFTFAFKDGSGSVTPAPVASVNGKASTTLPATIPVTSGGTTTNVSTAGKQVTITAVVSDLAGNQSASAPLITVSVVGSGSALTSIADPLTAGTKLPLSGADPAFVGGNSVDVFGILNDAGLSSWDLQLLNGAGTSVILDKIGFDNGAGAPTKPTESELTISETPAGASTVTPLNTLNAAVMQPVTVAPGLYKLRLQTYPNANQTGTPLTTVAKPIVIDNQAPALNTPTITFSSGTHPLYNGSYYFNNTLSTAAPNSAAITLTISDAVTNEGLVPGTTFRSAGSVGIYEGLNLVSALSTLASDSDTSGGVSASYTLPTAATAISEGTHTYEVVAIDRAGNRNAGHVTTVPIVIDRTNPTVSISNLTTQAVVGQKFRVYFSDANLNLTAPATTATFPLTVTVGTTTLTPLSYAFTHETPTSPLFYTDYNLPDTPSTTGVNVTATCVDLASNVGAATVSNVVIAAATSGLSAIQFTQNLETGIQTIINHAFYPVPVWVNGKIQVFGTVNEANLTHWSLDLASPASGNLGSGYLPKTSVSELTINETVSETSNPFITTGLAGFYTLQLTTTTTAGAGPAHTAPIIVDNTLPAPVISLNSPGGAPFSAITIQGSGGIPFTAYYVSPSKTPAILTGATNKTALVNGHSPTNFVGLYTTVGDPVNKTIPPAHSGTYPAGITQIAKSVRWLDPMNNPGGNTDFNDALNASGTAGAAVSYNLGATSGLSDGIYDFQVIAVDRAGNRSKDDAYHLTNTQGMITPVILDNTPPVVTFLQLHDNQIVAPDYIFNVLVRDNLTPSANITCAFIIRPVTAGALGSPIIPNPPRPTQPCRRTRTPMASTRSRLRPTMRWRTGITRRK